MSQTQPSDRYIPERIKHEVRKRCFYGCVICGAPVFQYNHMDPFASVQDHQPESLTLLCPGHHNAKTVGLLPNAKVMRANQSPFNARHKYTSRQELHSFGQQAIIELSTMRFTFDFQKYSPEGGCWVIAVNGTLLMGLDYEDGTLLPWLYGTDEDGIPLLVVERGELIVSTSAWDYVQVGRRIILRDNQTKKIVLDFRKLDNGFRLNRALVVHEGIGIQVHNQGVTFIPSGTTWIGQTFKDCRCAFSIGKPCIGFVSID